MASVVNSASFLQTTAVASPQTTATLGFTPAVGDVLYVFIRISAASITSLSLSDSVNGSYTALGTITANGNTRGQWFKVTVATATAPTFTITWSTGNSTFALEVAEVTSLNGDDVVGTGATGTSTTPASGNVTASQTDLLLVGYATLSATTWATALDKASGAAMTINQPTSGSQFAAIASLAGETAAGSPYAPRITIGSSIAWVAAALLIKDVAAGGVLPAELLTGNLQALAGNLS